MSAAALVTGVMALVLAQTLNPAGSETSPAAQLVIAAESPSRWLTMGVLFFLGAASIVLGAPSVLTLLGPSRGRRAGIVGVALLTVGSVGLGGLSALMLMYQSIALEVMASPMDRGEATRLVTSAVADPALMLSVQAWLYSFLLGVLLITIALFRSRTVPLWVPGLLVAFLAVQFALPVLGHGPDARIASSIGLVLFTAGFTGIATNAAGLDGRLPVTHSWALDPPPATPNPSSVGEAVRRLPRGA